MLLLFGLGFLIKNVAVLVATVEFQDALSGDVKWNAKEMLL